jgi:uncharacterized protein (DUF1501 family)
VPEGRAAALSRRTLLKGLGLGALAAAGTPAFAQAVYADTPGYDGDILIVLSLRGGMDGLSAVAPVGDPDYARLRPTIAVPASKAVPTGDRMFGLHPALAPLQPLWDAGLFGAVHAVGTPDQSRSHFQATEELERAAPGSGLRTGWLNRVMGTRPTSGSPFESMQAGKGIPSPLLGGPDPVLAVKSLEGFTLAADWTGPRFAAAVAALHAGSPRPWAAAASSTLAAVGRTAELAKADPAPAHGASYPATDLGRAMRDVARLVKADAGLQSVAVDMGDWDLHSGLGAAGGGEMADRLGDLAGALLAFATDIGAAMLARTTLVTMSEFGRRAAENGSGGADHGHGNAVLLLGGGIVGGKVHGRWPGLTDASLDHGDLAGTTDYRDVLADVLRHRCGMSDLSSVFPGYTPRALGISRSR